MAIANQTKTIVGVFNSVQDAHAAVRELEGQGISRDEISIVANKNASGYDTMEDRDKAADVVADAGIGAAIGGVGGLLLAAAGAITIPVIGPVLAAGPIAAALTGAGIGAAAGGLVGALTESGVPEEHAKHYAEGVRRGDILVTVKTTGTETDRVCDILDRHNAIDVDDRVSNWKTRGWSGYRDDAEPLSSDELRREREYYGSGTVGTTGMSGAGLSSTYPATGTANYPGQGDTARGMSREVTDEVNTGRSDLQSGWRNVTDRDRDGRNDMGEGVREMGRDIKEFGQDVLDKTKRGADRVADKGRDLTSEARGNERRMDVDNPYSQDLPTSTDYRDDVTRRRRARVYDHIKS
jgi:uncharacterized membrane protein